jgi:hypothetical protein
MENPVCQQFLELQEDLAFQVGKEHLEILELLAWMEIRVIKEYLRMGKKESLDMMVLVVYLE